MNTEKQIINILNELWRTNTMATRLCKKNLTQN